jgi:ketosteroid isomerase-like protein
MNAFGLFAVLGTGPVSAMRMRAASDYATLRELNAQYVRAFLQSDVAWYDAHLTPDFVCVLTNGTPISRAEFLEATRNGPGVEEYRMDDVTIRIHGNAALVGAVGTWRRGDGSTGKTRYVDVYVKTPDGWRVASAQLTSVR